MERATFSFLGPEPLVEKVWKTFAKGSKGSNCSVLGDHKRAKCQNGPRAPYSPACQDVLEVGPWC